MARFDLKQRVIEVKIVYYGPGLSGKTTNVRRLHGLIPTRFIGDLATLDTHDERTLFFDYFPYSSATTIGDFRLRLEVFSVPGQAQYIATRHMVLQNADGVIFVADSQGDQLENNALALKDLEKNLKSYGKVPEDFPVVFQYNKRDLAGSLSIDELERKLNPRHQPFFEAIAIEGKGVIQSFNAIVDLVKVAQARSIATRSGKPGGTVDLVGSEEMIAAPMTVAERVAKIAETGEHKPSEIAEALRRSEGPAKRRSSGDEGAASSWATPTPREKLRGGTWDLVKVEPISDGRVRFLLTDSLMEDGEMEIWVQREQLAPLLQSRPQPAVYPPEEARPTSTPPLTFLLLVWLAAITVWLILG